MHQQTVQKVEFGDFQTPLSLAREVAEVVARAGFSPSAVIEPTCGEGAFLLAALEQFSSADSFLGLDQNAAHVERARLLTQEAAKHKSIQILQGNFFDVEWPKLIAHLPRPFLILGNPPWVTNATLGNLGSTNHPEKKNQGDLRGIEAITGRSNFDISEWMIRQSMGWLEGGEGMLAVLCKTTVARKVLSFVWSQNLSIATAEIRRIDAKRYFNASVDACLLIIGVRPGIASRECSDYDSLAATTPRAIFGIREGVLVADIPLFERRRELLGRGLIGWRSGIKHDCSSVFELTRGGTNYRNGVGTDFAVEEEVIFPLLKSSDLANHNLPRKWLLVPQRTITDSPELLRDVAPKAWEYLCAHTTLLAKRSSTIYRNRPPFSIFGIGAYSFSRWKVGISGLYKKLDFVPIAPFEGKPVVLDDTCYFYPCDTQHECDILCKLVQSEAAQEFWSSLIFWDAKRPITAQILNLLDLKALGRIVGIEYSEVQGLSERQVVPYVEGTRQLLLFQD